MPSTSSLVEASAETDRIGLTERLVTVVIVAVPVLGTLLAGATLWGRGLTVHDVVLAAVLYAVSGFGITAGFHRLFTHQGFVPNRGVKIGLAVAGSLAFEGSVSAWVANHRLHHARSDQPGDPHSPYAPPDEAGEVDDDWTWRGLWRSHTGWLFSAKAAPVERYAADIEADADLARVSRLFPVISLAGLAVPFLVGLAVEGSLAGGAWTVLWAGAVRVALLHHVTWSINSICHIWGRRPFRTRDRSANVAWLALLSFGESWHNAHHAFPSVARHGILSGQIDTTATLIRLFERLGWADKVRWPTERMTASASV
jgi:stearoyl-CoA desaturase (delta-9 desaturase)